MCNTDFTRFLSQNKMVCHLTFLKEQLFKSDNYELNIVYEN